MSDPYWTLWATPTRPTRRTPLEEYLRLEFPTGDGSALLTERRLPAGRGRGPIPRATDRPPRDTDAQVRGRAAADRACASSP